MAPREITAAGIAMLRMSEIERSLLVESLRLLQRAAKGHDIRADAQRFVADLEISPSGEKDSRGNPIERVYFKRATD
jgi:hypothetical protein